MFPVVTMKQDNSAKGFGFYIFYDVATFDAGGLLCLMDIKKLCHTPTHKIQSTAQEKQHQPDV